MLGFFVSGHPLDQYREKLRNLKVVDTAAACEMKPEPQVFRRGSSEPQNEIQMAGVITGLKVAKSKRSGEMYAQACLEDSVGKIELIAFSTVVSEAGGEAEDRCAGAGSRCAARRRRFGAEAVALEHSGAGGCGAEAAGGAADQGSAA